VREDMRRREEKWQAEEADCIKRMKMIEKSRTKSKEESKNNVIISGIGKEIYRGG
jgi:hypothetical protein